MICCAFVRLSNRALNFHVELYEMHEHFISSEFSFDDTGHGSFEIVVQIVSDYDFSLGGSALASTSPIS